MVAQIRLPELGERDVLLLKSPVPVLEEVVTLDGRELVGEVLVASVERHAVAPPSDADTANHACSRHQPRHAQRLRSVVTEGPPRAPRGATAARARPLPSGRTVASASRWVNRGECTRARQRHHGAPRHAEQHRGLVVPEQERLDQFWARVT